jgi:BlaI family penicillinase repressor
MATLFQISDAEWIVMEVLWRRGRVTAGEVIADLAGTREWNHRTIRTLLARLVEKGAVDVTDSEHRYVYRPAVSRERCVRQESRSFLDKVFGGDAAELLLHFARHANISAEQAERLRRLLDEKHSKED